MSVDFLGGLLKHIACVLMHSLPTLSLSVGKETGTCLALVKHKKTIVFRCMPKCSTLGFQHYKSQKFMDFIKTCDLSVNVGVGTLVSLVARASSPPTVSVRSSGEQHWEGEGLETEIATRP